MKIIDYNGEGKWSQAEIVSRYNEFRKRLKFSPREVPSTNISNGKCIWIFPYMQKMIDFVKEGDLAAIEICIQLIEVDTSMSFGMTLKCTAARALKIQASLINANQQKRIHARIADMIARNYLPRELKEYKKLQKRLPLL